MNLQEAITERMAQLRGELDHAHTWRERAEREPLHGVDAVLAEVFTIRAGEIQATLAEFEKVLRAGGKNVSASEATSTEAIG